MEKHFTNKFVNPENYFLRENNFVPHLTEAEIKVYRGRNFEEKSHKWKIFLGYVCSALVHAYHWTSLPLWFIL